MATEWSLLPIVVLAWPYKLLMSGREPLRWLFPNNSYDADNLSLEIIQNYKYVTAIAKAPIPENIEIIILFDKNMTAMAVIRPIRRWSNELDDKTPEGKTMINIITPETIA